MKRRYYISRHRDTATWMVKDRKQDQMIISTSLYREQAFLIANALNNHEENSHGNTYETDNRISVKVR